ncbi:MAG: hypothetical protein B6D61_09190 [Bacteroidetes bacterium 4484_249]|nr:MAG: hypothetical protein B6D61_09190 [Bacteroidetes bacterium 4484_249]
MKEQTKKKILGRKFYSIYRRVRYIRFLKKKRKLRKKQLIIEGKLEKIEINKTYKEQKKQERILYKQKQKQIKLQNKQEQREIKIKIKEERKKAKALEKRKQELERQEKKQEVLEVKKRIKEKELHDKIIEQKKKNLSKLEKKENKRQQKEWRRLQRKENFRNFIHEIKTFDRQTLKKLFWWAIAIAKNKEQRNSFLVITLNSFFLFILSYMFLYMLSQIITVWVSLSFEYKTIVFYYKIFYNIDSGDWSADSVKILYSIMPVTGLLFGTIFIILYSTFRNEAGVFKLFFLWGFIHGMVMFFGSLLMGTLLNKDFGWVIAYMYYRDTGKMVFSIFSIFALVSIGTIISKSFLISGNAYFNFIDKTNKKFLLSSQVILPAIFGILVIIALKIPNDFYFGTTDEMFYEIMKVSTILLLLIPLLVSFRSFNDTYFDEEPRKIKLNWAYLLITVIVVFALRYGFTAGLHFGE